MDIDFIQAIDDATRGCSCHAARREHGWSFMFGAEGKPGCGLFVIAPWRIISGDEIAHAVDDDGQWFGLPEPVDGEAKANGLFGGKRVRAFAVDRTTADLRVQFEGDIRLDVFGHSAGYESSNATFEHDAEEVTLIGGGGGRVSFVSVPKGTTPEVVVSRPIPKP